MKHGVGNKIGLGAKRCTGLFYSNGAVKGIRTLDLRRDRAAL